VIDNSAISAEHAVIVSMLQDAFLEDLNSTNGTRVNGQRIKKHFLKNDDVIELAKYKIRFVNNDEAGVASKAFQSIVGTKVEKRLHLPIGSTASHKMHRDGNTIVLTPSDHQADAIIRIVRGPDAGKEITLSKPLTTIGMPGFQNSVVTRRGEMYSLTHVEGNTYPFVNGKSIGSGAYELQSGDVIQMAYMEMEFIRK
jgi:pSer/pThr/pTyr-binding forkhead associated (FHA) protein